MELSERPHDPESDDPVDDALASIVGRAWPPEDANLRQPTPEDIEAYVLGSASDEQREIVNEAMCRSRTLTAEVLARIEAEADLADPEFRQRLDAVQVPVRQLRDKLRSGGSARGKRVRATDEERPRSAARWTAWLWRPAVGYSLALLLLFVIPLSWRVSERPEAELPVREFTLSGLRVETTRSVSDGSEPAPDYETLSLGADETVVDLVVRAHPSFQLSARLSFGAVLRSAAGDTVLSARGIRRLVPIDDKEGSPALRVDVALLVPGRYSLEFLPHRSDGSPIERARVIGYFEIVAP